MSSCDMLGISHDDKSAEDIINISVEMIPVKYFLPVLTDNIYTHRTEEIISKPDNYNLNLFQDDTDTPQKTNILSQSDDSAVSI